MSEPLRLSNLIAPSFHALHKQIKTKPPEELWCKGGRGSTKSSFISLEVILYLSQNPKANLVGYRRYDNELRSTIYSQLQWAIEKLGQHALWDAKISPMKLIYEPSGNGVYFLGADNPDKAKSFTLPKGYIWGAWFEEVDQFGGMDEIRKILQTLFRGGNESRIAFYSYNPPKSSRSWVNRESKIAKPGRVTHHSDYRDVPHDWLGDRFIAEAEHLRQVNETAYRHEYLGEEVGTGLEVFLNVTEREITDEEISRFDRISQGLDFGYAVDPVAFVRMYFDKTRRRVYIFREVTGIGVSNRMLAQQLTSEEKQEQTIADSAEPKSIEELRSEYGLRIKGAKKGPGSVEHGVKWLADLEEIIIDPERCPLAAFEFVNYSLDVNRQGDIISKYPDKDNHIIDAARYGLQDDMTDRYSTVGRYRKR